MGEVILKHAIPTLRVTKAETVLPMYTALGFAVAWEHWVSSLFRYAREVVAECHLTTNCWAL